MRAELNQGLIDFLKASPTPFHATASLARRLEAAGYRRLDERDAWHTEAGGRYYVTRNDSSLIAIRLGRRSPLESGFRLVGAHTDSPCLRVKPNPEIARNGFLQLGVEVYGGALRPWFDRDLSLAGRVTFRANGKLESRLVDFRKAIAVIPNLAIHLNRAANEGWPINAQNELPPIIAQLAPGEAADFRLLLDEQLLREHGITADVVLDYELSFYDTQSAAVVGLNDEFIAGARLDNLLSCHAGLEALLNAEGDENCILVCTDHEEVGSCSHCGADGPFLEQVLPPAAGRRRLQPGDPALAAGLGRQRPWRTPELRRQARRQPWPGAERRSGDQDQQQPALCQQRNRRLLPPPLPGQRSAGAELRDPQRHGMRLDHRPDHRQPGRRAHRRHRPADLRHALDSRAGRQP